MYNWQNTVWENMKAKEPVEAGNVACRKCTKCHLRLQMRVEIVLRKKELERGKGKSSVAVVAMWHAVNII